MVEQTYRVDMIPNGVPLVVHVSQYDTEARTLIFELYKGDVAYEVPAGAVASIAGTKPDKTAFIYPMSIDGNVVSIDLQQQMAIVAGDVLTEIQITNSSGKIGSANFVIRVERGPIDEDSVISETDLPIFEQLVSDAQTAANEAQTAAEDAADAAESVGSIVPASAGTTGQVLTKTANGADWADKYPSGGTAGQVLTKTANGEAWEDVDGLPAGGTAGQVLTKNSSTDGDASWQTQQSGGGTWGSITGTLSDQTDLQNALNAKANTNAIESEKTARENGDSALHSEIESVRSAVGSPLVASTAAEMTNTNKVYVYTGSETGYTNGHWYYYNGTSWVDGGVYNSTAFNTDTTLTVSGAAADAKVAGDAVNDLKSSLNEIDNAVCYYSDNWIPKKGGAISAYPTRVFLAKFRVDADTVIRFTDLEENAFTSRYMVAYTCFDTDGTTVIVPDTGWKWYDVVGSVTLEAGQYIQITTKFDPEAQDTSQDGAVEIIRNAVRFYTKAQSVFDGLEAKLDGCISDADFMRYTPSYSLGVINIGNGKTINSSQSRMYCDYFNVEPGTIIRVKNTVLSNKEVYIAVYWYDKDKDFISCDITHYQQNPIAYNTVVDYVSEISGFARITVYWRYDPALTKTLIEQLSSSVKMSVAKAAIQSVSENPVDAEFIKKIRDQQTGKSLCFVWASDMHYQRNSNSAYGISPTVLKNIAKVASAVKADFITVTGDVVNGYNDISIQKSDLIDVTNALCENANIPAYIIEGNHDDNSWYVKNNGDSTGTYQGMSQVMTNDKFTAYAMNYALNGVVVDEDNPGGGYFYKDFAKAKIRCIFLNTTDIPYIENSDGTLKYYGQWTFGFQEKQMDWLANKALKFTESGWGVALFMHFDGQLDDAVGGSLSDPKCWYYVKQILAAYKTKSSGAFVSDVADFAASVSYDFTQNASNEIIGFFSGHVHADQNATVDGDLHVDIVCTFNYSSTPGYGFDVVTIDRVAGKVYTSRYLESALSEYDRELNI